MGKNKKIKMKAKEQQIEESPYNPFDTDPEETKQVEKTN